MPSSSPKHIVILGAGIIGLQTALALQNEGYIVTIVARDIPGDEDPRLYTSAWAGAHWRSHAGSDDEEQQSWDRQTYEQWMLDIKDGKGEEQGLATYPSYLYWYLMSRSLAQQSPFTLTTN